MGHAVQLTSKPTDPKAQAAPNATWANGTALGSTWGNCSRHGPPPQCRGRGAGRRCGRRAAGGSRMQSRIVKQNKDEWSQGRRASIRNARWQALVNGPTASGTLPNTQPCSVPMLPPPTGPINVIRLKTSGKALGWTRRIQSLGDVEHLETRVHVQTFFFWTTRGFNSHEHTYRGGENSVREKSCPRLKMG